MTRQLVALGLLVGCIWLLVGCRAAAPQEVEVLVTVEVPVIQTVVVRETREVERTVVVTATPEPTPAYRSTLVTAPGTLVYPLPLEPKSLDPQQTGDEVSALVVQQLYEGLFHLLDDGAVAPAAATGHEVSADGLTYTVTLRSGLTWADGAPVTAQHYVDGVCRLLDPLVGSAYYYLLTEVAGISGARDYASGEIADCAAIGMQAPDDRTLVIRLDAPVAYFPQLLATHLFLPARLDLHVGSTSAPMATGEQATTHGTLVGNGPYSLSEWHAGERLILEKNPLYWDSANVSVARIEFPIVQEQSRQLELFLAGEVASFWWAGPLRVVLVNLGIGSIITVELVNESDERVTEGKELFMDGDVEGAEAAYREALRMKPGSASALYNLAVLLRVTGRLPEARGLLVEASGLGEHPDAEKARQLLEKLGRGDKQLPR